MPQIETHEEWEKRNREWKERGGLPYPDWEVWSKIRNALLWEVVALSCDLDPDSLRGWIFDPLKWRNGYSRRPPKIFLDRLRLAESLLSINGGGLACRAEGDHSRHSRVELGNFRAWLEYEGITLPSEFPEQTAHSPPSESPEQRKLRLTHRIAEVRGTRKDFMAFVATEASISVQRLQQIVGTATERKQRIAQRVK